MSNVVSTEWFFGDRDLTDAHTIRRKVFIEEQNINESIELDGSDAECFHLVAYEGTVAVATGRIRITADGFSIGRVAVLKAFRGKHYGVFVMQILIHACYLMGGERQTISAQLPVRAFYEKLGFTAVGDVYDEAGIPHITMERFGDSKKLCKEKGVKPCESINF